MVPPLRRAVGTVLPLPVAAPALLLPMYRLTITYRLPRIPCSSLDECWDDLPAASRSPVLLSWQPGCLTIRAIEYMRVCGCVCFVRARV